MGTLYVVATPIGNLADITIRAIETLKSVDAVLAEDTRITKRLFDYYKIQSPLYSYHQHSKDQKKFEILKNLLEGKSLALVTDAGTPGISDPGNELIDFLLANGANIKIVSIPGASAITAALATSGFNASNFSFIGFLPKKKLNKTLKSISENEYATVYFDSPFRVIKNLKKLEEYVGTRRVFVARELTKIYETLYRGTIKEVLEKLQKANVKGEVVIVVESK